MPAATPLPQVVGKLRIRLSCVAPNTPITASLPLLAERKRGAQAVGFVSLGILCAYPARLALARSYVAAPLPAACYYTGLSEGRRAADHHMTKLVCEWLEGTNPPMPRAALSALTDSERWVGACGVCVVEGWIGRRWRCKGKGHEI